MARPAKEVAPRRPITPEEREMVNRVSIQAMAACGASPDDMAGYLNMPPADLKAQYADEIKEGVNRLRYSLEIQVAGKAKSGDTRCLLAWLKQYGGWTEVTRREITGANGEPITIRNLDAPSLDQLIIALRQAEAVEGRSGRSLGSQQAGGSGRIIDMESISGPPDESAEE